MSKFDEIRRDSLATLADCCLAFHRIDRKAESDLVQDARNQLLDGRLTAVTIGEYKRGKSSLVGALVEDPELFPVNVDITTSLITSIEDAAEEQITVFMSDKESSTPQWISRDQIADFVTEQGNPRNRRAARLLRIQTPNERQPQSFRRSEVRLLIVLESVFRLHVCFSSVRLVRGAPGMPGCAPAPTAPGWSSFPVVRAVCAGHEGAGRAQSRCQQARNASFHGQSVLMARTRCRAWRASRAGRCQIR